VVHLKGFSPESIIVDGIPEMDTPPYFNFDGTHARSPPKDAKASFLVCLFHTLGSIWIRLQSKSLPWQFSLQGLINHLLVFGTYVQTIGTLQHAFEATTTEKEVALEEALNAKKKVLHLKNELHQAQT
jgi:hypothetical protein